MEQPSVWNAEVAVRRLAANLFLRPRVVRVFTEYWLNEYTPLAVRTGAPTPATNDPGHWMACLVQRALVAPRELALRSQGGMAVRPNAQRPHYVHVCNWTAPAHDFALAVPLAHFERCGLSHVMLSWVPLFADAWRFWSTVAHGNAMGQVVCEQFLWGKAFASAYRPSLVVAMLYERFLKALLDIVPPGEWLAVVPGVMERALAPLRNRATLRRELLNVPEQQILENLPLRIGADCARDPREALRGLEALVENLSRFVAAEYTEWRDELDVSFYPEQLLETIDNSAAALSV